MPFSQTGANYRNQAILDARDRVQGEAFSDIASQIQAIRVQGNFGQSGPPSAPHPVTAIAVSAAAGFATVKLTHAGAPAGTRYVIEYSTTPNFLNPVRIDNGVSDSWEQYLAGKTLYVRAAAMFPASALSSWTYFGSAQKPTAVVI